MNLGIPELDWSNALGSRPVEPDPKLEAATAELRANTTVTHIDSKRNLTRNLVMLVMTLSGLLALTGVIREKQEQQRTQQQKYQGPILSRDSKGWDGTSRIE